MIQYNNLRDVKVGDPVVVNPMFSEAVRKGLEADKVYTVIGVHPLDGRGHSGTVTVEGATNPNASAGWEPGSYGFGVFRKVLDTPKPTTESEKPMNYTTTQRADQFVSGDRVVVRDAGNTFVASQDTLKPGEVYTIDRIEIVNENLGTGQFRLVERQDGDFDGAFGHLLFDRAPADAAAAADAPLKVGDPVKITAGHEAFRGRTGVIKGVEGSRFTLTLDNPPSEDERMTSDPNGGLWLAESLERTTDGWEFDLMPSGEEPARAPDLSDSDVRKGLPIEEAYPIGSVWNHISSGSQPVTITGYADPTPLGREQVAVTVPEYLGEQPYEGTWVRGALDSYGTLVSLPDDSNTLEVDEPEAPTLNVGDEVPLDTLQTVAGITVTRDGRGDQWVTHGDKTMTRLGSRRRMGVGVIVPEYDPDRGNNWVEDGWKFVSMVENGSVDERDALKDAVDTLRHEIETLKQAAADERRRLCAEIDTLKAARDSLSESRAEIAEARATLADEVRDLKSRLASSEDRANEGWATAAREQAISEFMRLNFLGDSDLDKVEGFENGWDARNKA